DIHSLSLHDALPIFFDHNGANTSRVRVLPLPVNTPTQRACINSSARSFSADSCRWYTRRTPVPVNRASKATNHQRGREERTHPTRTRIIVARIELSTPRTKAAIVITPPVRGANQSREGNSSLSRWVAWCAAN